jgi:DNA replication protein DnaC
MDEKSVKSIHTLVSRSGEHAGVATKRNTAVIVAEDGSNCSVCNDTGWKDITVKGEKRVTRCDCFLSRRAPRLLQQAKIPTRYERCDLDSFRTEGDHSLAAARMVVENFVREYPLSHTGLMLIGSIGAGKTHLAVAAIREIVTRKGVPCLFCEYRELLKQIQDSYNNDSQTTELEVLRPIFETDVIVLDELGAVKPSQWVWDTVSFILNTRYNDDRTTIITTNLLDEAALGLPGRPKGMREDSLGDRIGERMRSRLHEMCRVVTIRGEDYRQNFRSGTSHR